jgi:hypothetical protein
MRWPAWRQILGREVAGHWAMVRIGQVSDMP